MLGLSHSHMQRPERVGVADMTCKEDCVASRPCGMDAGQPQHDVVAGIRDFPPTTAVDDSYTGLMSPSFRRCCPVPRRNVGAVRVM